MRSAAAAVGGITVLFAVVVFLLRDQVFSAFVADPAVLGIGAIARGLAEGSPQRAEAVLEAAEG